MTRQQSDVRAVEKHADLERVCAALASLGAPQLPLYRAAADRRIALITFGDPAARWPADTLAALKRPVVCLIGDDPQDGGHALGPDAWACARRLRYWQRGAMIHGSGGEPDHYRWAVAAAELTGRVALVETSSVMLPAWTNLIGIGPTTLIIVPKNGGSHPIVPARGPLH